MRGRNYSLRSTWKGCDDSGYVVDNPEVVLKPLPFGMEHDAKANGLSKERDTAANKAAECFRHRIWFMP